MYAGRVGQDYARPNESTALTVSLNLAEYASDTVHSRVQITTAEDLVSVPTIEVSAEVQPELIVTPNSLDFGNVKRGRMASATLTISQRTRNKYRVTEVAASNGIEAVLTPRKLEGNVRTVEVTILPDADSRRYQGKVVLETNIPRIPTITVPVRARFIGIECSVTPTVLVFQDSSPGSSVGSIVVLGEPNLKVAKAESDSHYVTAAITASENSDETTVVLALTPETPNGDLTARVTLTLTEGGLIETRNMIVTGRVVSAP